MPLDDRPLDRDDGSFKTRYYRSGKTDSPIIYVQDEASWCSYMHGEPPRRSMGEIPPDILALSEEIDQEEAARLTETTARAAAPVERVEGAEPAVVRPHGRRSAGGGWRLLVAPLAGLAVFFVGVVAISAVVEPTVDLSSVWAVAAVSIRTIVVPLILGALVFTLFLGPEHAWSARLGWRLGIWFGMGVLALNIVVDLIDEGKGPFSYALGLQGGDQWLCGALLAVQYLALGAAGGLLASWIGYLTARRWRTAEATGLRPWHIGAGLAGLVVILAIAGTLLSSSWSSAWNPLYGSGGTPEDLARAESLAREAADAQALGDTQAALDLYSQAVATEPTSGVAWEGRTILLAAKGRYEDALDCTGSWTASLPEDPSAWYYRGCALEAVGRYEDAVGAYEESIRLTEEQGAGTQAAAPARSHVADCEEILADPARLEEEEYFDEAEILLADIGDVNDWTARILDAATKDEKASLLEDFASKLQESIDPALKIPAPSTLRDRHDRLLVDGLLELDRGAAGMLSALEAGDSAGYDEWRETLLSGSAKIDSYRDAMPDPFGR